MNEMKKSPALAGFLSMLPGLGQAYVGYYTQGFIFILIFGACIAAMDHARGIEALLGPFIAFWWFFNIIDAVRKAKLYNAHQMGAAEAKLPTDSPLVGGIILLVIGVILTAHITFDIDMEWLENVWPLGLIAGGLYLVWKYQRAKQELRSPSPYGVVPPPMPDGLPPMPGESTEERREA